MLLRILLTNNYINCGIELPLLWFGDDNVIGEHVDKQWFKCDLGPELSTVDWCNIPQHTRYRDVDTKGKPAKTNNNIVVHMLDKIYLYCIAGNIGDGVELIWWLTKLTVCCQIYFAKI